MSTNQRHSFDKLRMDWAPMDAAQERPEKRTNRSRDRDAEPTTKNWFGRPFHTKRAQPAKRVGYRNSHETPNSVVPGLSCSDRPPYGDHAQLKRVEYWGMAREYLKIGIGVVGEP